MKKNFRKKALNRAIASAVLVFAATSAQQALAVDTVISTTQTTTQAYTVGTEASLASEIYADGDSVTVTDTGAIDVTLNNQDADKALYLIAPAGGDPTTVKALSIENNGLLKATRTQDSTDASGSNVMMATLGIFGAGGPVINNGDIEISNTLDNTANPNELGSPMVGGVGMGGMNSDLVQNNGTVTVSNDLTLVNVDGESMAMSGGVMSSSNDGLNHEVVNGVDGIINLSTTIAVTDDALAPGLQHSGRMIGLGGDASGAGTTVQATNEGLINIDMVGTLGQNSTIVKEIVGIFVDAQDDSSLTNSGNVDMDINLSSAGSPDTAIMGEIIGLKQVGNGFGVLNNSGAVTVDVNSAAQQEQLMVVGAMADDLALAINTGSIDVNLTSATPSETMVMGMGAYAQGIINQGVINVNVTKDSLAPNSMVGGVFAGITKDNGNFNNSGDVAVHVTTNNALGVNANGVESAIVTSLFAEDTMVANASIDNSGTLSASVSDTSGFATSENLTAYSFFGAGWDGTLNNTGSMVGSIQSYGMARINNAGLIHLDTDFDSHIAGDYSQTAGGELRVWADSALKYATLIVDGIAAFTDGTGLGVDVTASNSLALGDVMNDVVTAGTLVAQGFDVTDNSALFDFTASVDGNTIDITTIEGTTIAEIVANPTPDPTPDPTPTPTPTPDPTPEVNSVSSVPVPTSELARVLDGWVANSGTTNSADVANVVTGLGSLATNQEVVSAVESLIPTHQVNEVTDALLNTTKGIVGARLVRIKGMSSGDEYLADKNVWIKGFGASSIQGDVKGIDGYEQESRGFVIGMDAKKDGNTYGFGVQHSLSDIDVNNVSQKSEISSVVAIAYAELPVAQEMSLELQASLGKHDMNGERYIAFMNRTAEAKYNSTSFYADAQLTRAYKVSDKMTLTPSVGATYQKVSTESYTETGAGALNLHVDSMDSTRFDLGVKGKAEYQATDAAKVFASVGVKNDFINDDTEVHASFASEAGSNFSTPSINGDSWLTQIGAGVEFRAKEGVDVMIRYDLDKSTDYIGQSASAKVKWAF